MRDCMSNTNASPEGVKLLSPARKCWECMRYEMSPVGATEHFSITLLTEKVQGQPQVNSIGANGCFSVENGSSSRVRPALARVEQRDLVFRMSLRSSAGRNSAHSHSWILLLAGFLTQYLNNATMSLLNGCHPRGAVMRA